MNNKKSRLIAILGPIGLLILSFALLSPRLGFEFFPSGDSPFINVDISAREGTDTDAMTLYMSTIDDAMSQIPEIKTYSYTISNENITLSVELLKKGERNKQNMRNSFAVETEITDRLASLTIQGLQVSIAVQA